MYCAYARTFPAEYERNHHLQVAVSLRALFKREQWLRDHIRNDPRRSDLEISQLAWARDLSQVRSSRVKAGSVGGRSPLARLVTVIVDQEPVGLFFGQ
jgi:hypothetical protein